MPHKLRAVAAKLMVVSIRSSEGFTESNFPAVRALVDASEPDFFDYHPPHGFLAWFKPSSVLRARSLIANIHELRRRQLRFSDIGVGSAEGKVVFMRDWLRRIRSLPLGDVCNKAVFAAMADGAAQSGRDKNSSISQT